MSDRSVYSQNDEQEHIVRLMQHVPADRPRTFLDIGAYHPFTFSNTRALYEMGFKGIFVEPSPSLRPALEREYGNDPECQIMNVCVTSKDGMVTLYDSGGDAISSLDPEWSKKWGAQGTSIEVEGVSVETLIARSLYKTFDFINIDTEGNVFEILEQIDPARLGCRAMCVEYAWDELDKFAGYFDRHGLREVHRTGENIIVSARR